MKTKSLIVGRLSVVGRAIARGGAAFNLLIFVTVGVFLVNMAVSVGYSIFFQKDLTEKA